MLDTGDAQAVETFLAGRTWNHVVMSASQTSGGPVRELSLEDAYASMDSKFWGAYRVARSARIHDGGSLTIIGGYLAARPMPSAALQGAINAGLEGLVRGLALELAPVRVNTVSPGTIRTPLWSRMEAGQRETMFASLVLATRGRALVVWIGAARVLLVPLLAWWLPESLESLEKYNGTVVFVSHDRYFIDKLATRVIEVENGQVKSWPGN